MPPNCSWFPFQQYSTYAHAALSAAWPRHSATACRPHHSSGAKPSGACVHVYLRGRPSCPVFFPFVVAAREGGAPAPAKGDWVSAGRRLCTRQPEPPEAPCLQRILSPCRFDQRAPPCSSSLLSCSRRSAALLCMLASRCVHATRRHHGPATYTHTVAHKGAPPPPRVAAAAAFCLASLAFVVVDRYPVC